MIASYLRRGMAAGLLAGLFAFITGEPLLNQAIGLEESVHQEGHEWAGLGALFGLLCERANRRKLL